MALNDFQHLWDGSESGWKLIRVERQTWRLTFTFAESGPSLKEISSLRCLLDEFHDMPVNVVFSRLRSQAAYLLPRNLSNLEMHSLMKQAQQLGLRASVVEDDQSGYLPVDENGSALIIEDDMVAREVENRMLEAGVVVVEITHFD
ncbi:MAG: hypothetical protein B0A82_02855 [Alkalinema sp. CACIAM 70d]|nr:MAG: hypothetical protein B0A82_02855 [Alkalinema sp. CACIAM 70d]